MIKLSLKPEQLQKYSDQDGILYYVSRLSEDNPFCERDLDGVPFMDIHQIVGQFPVVLVDSPVAYAYVMKVHLKVRPHTGVEQTLRELAKVMFIPEGARRLVKVVRRDCCRCKIIKKRTVELQMSQHPAPRTTLAPPFYNAMVDIAYAFPGMPYKRARMKKG